MSAPGAAGTQTTHPYSCNTCQVAYRNIDLQKGHMKSDWHRYNLKRRIASLPPIPAEVFTEKVLQARAVTAAEADKALFEKYCDVCEKTYSSENSFQNHLSSQKHRAREAQGEPRKQDDEASSVMSSTFSLGNPIQGDDDDDDDDDEIDSDAEEEFGKIVQGLQKAKIGSETRPSPVKRPSNRQATEAERLNGAHEDRESNATPVPAGVEQKPDAWTPESCLFCSYKSPSAPLNAHHMERFHGMFIPEKAYLCDLEGLLKHLLQKVHDLHECLYCGKAKVNAFAVQTHMRDVGHCKIPYTTEEEQLDIGDFYDFRSTYSDEDDESEDDETPPESNGGARLGARRSAVAHDEDGNEIREEDGWETDSSASSIDSDELTAVQADGQRLQLERLDRHPHHAHDDPRHHHQADGWHSHAHKPVRAVFHDDFELHLPSGRSVGHRDFNRYYRQNLHNHYTGEERTTRQAIEDADAANRGRQLATRAEAGIVGLSSQAKKGLAQATNRNQEQMIQEQKKSEWRRERMIYREHNRIQHKYAG